MKILIVHYRYFISGGPERYLFNVTNLLESRGHQVVPFSVRVSKNRSTSYERYFADNIGKCDAVFVNDYPKTPSVYCDMLGREFYSFHVKKKLKALIQAEKPDVCYLLAYKRALSPSVIDACFEEGVPVVNRLSDYNMVCPQAGLYRDGKVCEQCVGKSWWPCVSHRCVKNSLLFSLVRVASELVQRKMGIYHRIAKFVCTNGFMTKQMQKGGFEAKRLVTIPTFYPDSPEENAKDRSNHLNGPIRLLFIGNIDESKGAFDLLAALNALKKHTANFRLAIVGGIREAEVRQTLELVAAYGLSDHVQYEPFRANGDVSEFYRNANVTVIPSRWVENLPNTLIESLYWGRPVIVPRHGSYLHTVDESVAFYFEHASQDSLMRTILDVCSHPNKIMEKSECAFDFCMKNYSMQSHCDALETLFESYARTNC